jgi:hypothetical protein
MLRWVPEDRITAKDSLNHPFFKKEELKAEFKMEID